MSLCDLRIASSVLVYHNELVLWRYPYPSLSYVPVLLGRSWSAQQKVNRQYECHVSAGVNARRDGQTAVFDRKIRSSKLAF